MTAITRKMPIEYAILVCGIGTTPILVSDCGNPPTEFVPSTISAMPRNSVSVPIVTAIEGSPSLVTSTPLSAPPAAPTIRTATIAQAIGQWCSKRYPSSVLESPSIEATERSISPVMTINVSGSAMIAISPMFSPMKNTSVDVKKCGDSDAPNRMLPRSTSTRPLSHRTSARHEAGFFAGGSATGAWLSVVGLEGGVLDDMVFALRRLQATAYP